MQSATLDNRLDEQLSTAVIPLLNGDECFYSISREHSDWYYLTGDQEEPGVKNQKLKH